MRGSVRKRASGRYQAQWREQDPATGKWKQRGRSFDTEAEADRYLVRVLADLQDDIPSEPSTMPLSEYLTVWLTGRRKLASNSRRIYANAIKNQITPHLGTIPIPRSLATR